MKLYGYEVQEGSTQDGRSYSFYHSKVFVGSSRTKVYDAAQSFVRERELELEANGDRSFYDFIVKACNVEGVE